MLVKQDAPVIEVNLESSIDRGYNLQVLAKSEFALPELFNEYKRLMQTQKSPKNAKL